MTREHNILFRAHVPSLVAALEDADSGVRETAKTTIIEIFQRLQDKFSSYINFKIAMICISKLKLQIDDNFW